MNEPTDTERLDWLERSVSTGVAGCSRRWTAPLLDHKTHRWCIFAEEDDLDVVDQPTLRAAIDAAMAAEEAKP